MEKFKNSLKFLLWLIFFITFASEFVKIVFELNPDFGHKPLRMANAFFWSSLFLIEMIMAGLVIYFIVKYPARRLRLIILSACHFTVILALPMLLDSWSWTCLLYPWPHSLQAFDPATPRTAFYISVFMGFAIVPLITYKWGAKAFCGYLCPHGAFFSETYGRVFSPKPMRLLRVCKGYPSCLFYSYDRSARCCHCPAGLHLSLALCAETGIFLYCRAFLLCHRHPASWRKKLLQPHLPHGLFYKKLW